MDRTKREGKVLHGLGFVPDEADIACCLLQDIKRYSDYYVTKATNHSKANTWLSTLRDVVCGPGEEVQKKQSRVLSPEACSLLSWINAIRDPLKTLGRDSVPYQPFQKMMIMDFMFYLTQKICPTETDPIIHQCKNILGLHNLTTEEIRAMKDLFSVKHSVYIIPRRHGKTSMFTALMATTILFVPNISIGYGCHRKKALKEAYKATLDVLSSIRRSETANFGQIWKVKTEANENIRVQNKETERWSSILFIPLQNDKVIFLVSYNCR